MVENSAPVSVALRVVHVRPDVDALRRITDARTDCHRHVICGNKPHQYNHLHYITARGQMCE